MSVRRKRWFRPGYSSPLGRRALRFLFLGLLLIALLAVVAYIAMLGIVRWKERSAESAWAALDGPDAPLSSRFVPLPENPGSRAYEELVNPLGLGTSSRGSLGQLSQEQPWDRILNDLHGYLETELERENATCSPTPPELSARLAPLHSTLAKARELWLSEVPPQWRSGPEVGRPHPPPHFLMFQLFAEWLMADALNSLSLQDSAGAEQNLDATWAVIQSLLVRPEIQAQATALALASELAGTLRKVELPTDKWENRLQLEPFRNGLEAVMIHEGQAYLNAGRTMAAQPFIGRGARRERWLWKLYGRLWVRYSFADTAYRLAEGFKKYRSHGFCGGELFRQQEHLRAGWWTLGGSNGVANHRADWMRLLRLHQNLEITRGVLLARELRRNNGGIWPESIDSASFAVECPQTHIRYSRSSYGGVVLEGVGYFQTRPSAGFIDLPLRFEARP